MERRAVREFGQVGHRERPRRAGADRVQMVGDAAAQLLLDQRVVTPQAGADRLADQLVRGDPEAARFDEVAPAKPLPLGLRIGAEQRVGE